MKFNPTPATTMKSRFLAIGLIAAVLFTASRVWAETKPGSWAELKGYHAVMSATFHPAEEGKLDPIKTRSAELVGAAQAWVASKPPADFAKPTIAEKLKLLQ